MTQISLIYFRMSFGFLKFGEKKVKPWWKRKEYKVPEEHFKLFKQPGKTRIEKFQKKFPYHNSSQFRHWILGSAVLLAFITLGSNFRKSKATTFSTFWNAEKNFAFPKLFCLTLNELVVDNYIMTQGVKMKSCLNDIKKESGKEHSIDALRKDLEDVVKRVQHLEENNFLRLFQHVLSFIIFGVALSIDYKGKSCSKDSNI